MLADLGRPRSQWAILAHPAGVARAGAEGGVKDRRTARRLAGGLLGAGAIGLLAVAGVATWGDGPLGMLPGGRLRGPESSAPVAGWAFAAASREIEVEVRPRCPRSVRTWFAVVDGRLYLSADFVTPWKRWPRQALEDPRARVRVAGRIVPVRLARVTDAERIARLRRAFARRYDVGEDSWLARVEVWFFRADPVGRLP